ncbi:hypothetical protein WJX73_005888 [Symbiochloris irregularis]|uniref:ABC transporter domain-containing protein n=1 Tax=Symbiochloris irregularis TaxID=706552 RepID=A0AAW1NNI5_9CHLO
MAVHYSIWVPALCVGYGLGIALLLYGLEKVQKLTPADLASGRANACRTRLEYKLISPDVAQTLGIFSSAYRRLFGLHYNGFKRHLEVVRSGNLAGMDKQHSGAHLDTPSDESPEESGDAQGLRHRDLAPREISLVPMGSTFSDDFGEEARPVRSYTLEVGHEHGGALRQLRSLRSTLSAAIDSYKSNKDVAEEPSDGDEVEQTRRFNDPGMNAGDVVPGEMCALVGPSGAGKSTLLDILALRKGTGDVSGQVHMNGGPRGRPFKRCSAYVPQEDVFEPVLTCWETLMFHAQLRLDPSVSRTERVQRVQDAIHAMGLTKAAFTQVGGILPGGIRVRGLSGGEQRRLSIACALIATPSIIFLDEPTTGLDSFAALNIMEHMAHLAIQGHAIIATIHQPRAAIWAMFHKVNVLSEGYQIYPYTVSDGAVSDWMIDLVSVSFAKPTTSRATMASRTQVSHAAALFADRHQGNLPRLSSIRLGDGTEVDSHGMEALKFQRYAVGWPKQFWVLYTRSMVTQLRNPSDICGRIIVTTTIGLLSGLAFFNLDDTVDQVFQHLVAEFFNLIVGYSIALFAVIVVLSALISIQFLTFCVWITPNQDVAFALGVAYVSLCVLVTDFFINYSELKILPAKWVSWISFTRYALQGLARLQYDNTVFAEPGSIINGLPGASIGSLSNSGLNVASGVQAGFKPTFISNGTQVLEYYEFSFSTGLSIGALVAFYVVFHLMSYVAMAYFNKKQR